MTLTEATHSAFAMKPRYATIIEPAVAAKMQEALGVLKVDRLTRAPGRPKGSTREKEVLTLVQEHPGISRKQLAEALGVGPEHAGRIVSRLVNGGYVRREFKAGHGSEAHYFAVTQ